MNKPHLSKWREFIMLLRAKIHDSNRHLSRSITVIDRWRYFIEIDICQAKMKVASKFLLQESNESVLYWLIINIVKKESIQ